jgi:glycosyltransferase 2 family protein
LKDKAKSFIRFLTFAAVGIFLFWLVYKDQPVGEIISALKNADYFYIGVSFIMGFLSHLSRALRWKILINSIGYYPKTLNTFFSVLVMYLSNTAIPRSGEITRCGLLKKYENVPFSKLIGTVIIERAIDFVILLILLVIVLISQFGIITEFLDKNPGTEDKLRILFNPGNLVLFFSFTGLIIFLFYVGRKKLKNSLFYRKILEVMLNMLEGMKAIGRLDKKWQFIAHSIFIWTMYFLMIYIVFQSFTFTTHLGLLTGLTIFVMASFGMVAPSPGGIGTWHFMVIETLVIYGINKFPDANAFALATHGSMTIFIVILGFISLLLLPVYNKKEKNIAN